MLLSLERRAVVEGYILAVNLYPARVEVEFEEKAADGNLYVHGFFCLIQAVITAA